MTPLAEKQLAAAPKDKPFFIYMHYMDPHDVYVKHKESPDWGNTRRDRYDSEVSTPTCGSASCWTSASRSPGGRRPW